MHVRIRLTLVAAVAFLSTSGLAADPVETVISVGGPDDCAAVASSRFTGHTAIADSFEDIVEIRDVDGTLLRTIMRGEIEALAPWMSLTSTADGPCAMAWSDSGRRLYIAVYDSNPATDGGASDAVLLYDRFENALVRFARLELSALESDWPHLAAVHFAGSLFVSDDAGNVHTIPAGRNQATSSVSASASLIDSSTVHGLAVDPGGHYLFATGASGVHRAGLDGSPLSFDFVSSASGARAVAWSSHYGGPGDEGIYVLTGTAGWSNVLRASAADARSGFFTLSPYLSRAETLHDIARTADGALVIGADEDALRVVDDNDTRLTLDAWIEDEFAQVVTFGKGLIAPDGEPSGWVIDGDVLQGGTRFHPATPDGACWVVLLLIANDHLYGDPQAQGFVREILRRYAGLAPSGPGASRSADGYFRHWIDPQTGQTKPGWPTEFATYSTMKLVASAIRAAEFYPQDADIREAARAIVCGVSDWDSYIQPGTNDVYLKSLPGGGPDPSARNSAFTEGIIFVEQAAAFGGAHSQQAWSRWIDRDLWPTATFVFGRPVTGVAPGSFLSGFITAYSWILQRPFREDTRWRAHVENLLVSHAAWTDENGPDYYTLFSAGTTKPEWGGYNADSLSHHPGDITTLTALMGLCADGDREPAVAAYQAYRCGARADWATGASTLYRRSAVDPAYQPNSAGLPDVAMGALGLAELIQPGAVDSVLAIDIPPGFCDDPCPADVNGDSVLDAGDFTAWIAAFNAGAPGCDQNGDGLCLPNDFTAWVANFNAGC